MNKSKNESILIIMALYNEVIPNKEGTAYIEARRTSIHFSLAFFEIQLHWSVVNSVTVVKTMQLLVTGCNW